MKLGLSKALDRSGNARTKLSLHHLLTAGPGGASPMSSEFLLNAVRVQPLNTIDKVFR